MKKKTWIWISLIFILTVGALLLAVYTNSTTSNESKDTTQIMLSKTEQEKALQEIIQMNEQGYRPAEIHQKIEETRGKVKKEQLTKMVRELVNSMETTSDYYSEMMYLMQSEIAYAKTIDGSDNIFQSKNATNLFVEGFAKEVERNFINIEMGDTSAYLEPDMVFISEQYIENIEGVFQDYVKISASAQEKPIFDKEKQRYVPERLRDLIEDIDNSKTRWKDTEYASDFQNLEKFYYETLFGNTQGTFFDKKIENEGEETEKVRYFLKEEILSEYESFIYDNKDLALSKDLKKYVEVLKENDLEINEQIQSYLDELMESKFPTN